MYHRIMIPLDGSATAERGLSEAIGLAEGQPVILHLMHVVDVPPMMMDMAVTTGSEETIDRLRQHGKEVLDNAKSRLAEVGVEAQTSMREITHGRVADAIVDEARKASCDLIVMGTHGRRGIKRLALGGDADLVVRTSPVPVLLVRDDDPTH